MHHTSNRQMTEGSAETASGWESANGQQSSGKKQAYQLGGSVVPLVSPLTETEDIDITSIKRLVQFHRTSGTDAIFVLGTCGEGACLADSAKELMVEAGMAKINFGEPFRFNHIKYFNELTDVMEHLWHPWRIMEEVKNRLCAADPLPVN